MSAVPFDPDYSEAQRKARRMMTWLLVAVITMAFASLCSAYIVSMSGGYWTNITLPEQFIWSSVVVLAGSATIHFALVSAKRGNANGIMIGLVLTLLSGIGFTWSQYKGWKVLMERNIYLSPGKMSMLQGEYGKDYSFSKNGEQLVAADGHFYLPDDAEHARPLDTELDEQRDRTGPYFYVLIWLHLAHLAAGLLSVLIMMLMATRRRYTVENHVGLWAGAVYWHFLGGLWIALFLFLSLVH